MRITLSREEMVLLNNLCSEEIAKLKRLYPALLESDSKDFASILKNSTVAVEIALTDDEGES